MLEKYLQILDESLDQKLEILTDIEDKSKEQSEMIVNDISLDEIDRNMDEKSELIDKINKMDDGFQAMYDKIKDELNEHKGEFSDQIDRLKKKIMLVMEKSTSIEAIEARNKAAMEKRFAVEHRSNSDRISVATAARSYYEVANKLNAITPQFMDQKN